jgi:hypothetical protein
MLRSVLEVGEWAKTHNEDCRFLDNRDLVRLFEFLPLGEAKTLFPNLVREDLDEETWNKDLKEWNQVNVLEAFHRDLDFAFDKCYGQRGISASLMSEVVQMWCYAMGFDHVLDIPYNNYGEGILDAAKSALEALPKP